MKLKVLTLNTWNHQGPWKDRWALVLDELKLLDPSVVLFQEITQKDWIVRALGEIGYESFAFADDGSGLMAVSRMPIVDFGYLPFETQSPTEGNLRSFLFFRVVLGSVRVLFINTHLSWKPEETLIRQFQTAELLRWMRRQNEYQEASVILTGDLNSHPDKDEIRQLLENNTLSDAFEALNPGVPGLTWDNRNVYTATHGLPDRRLDYILIRGRVLMKHLKKCEIVMNKADCRGIFPSDHYGLIAEWEIN